MFYDGNRHAIAREPLNHRDDFVRLVMSQARKSLVQQQDARLSSHRASKLHQPQFLGREFAGDAVGDLGQADAGNRVSRQLPCLGIGLGADIGAHHDIV